MLNPIVQNQSIQSQIRHEYLNYVQTMNNKVVCNPFMRKDAANKNGIAPVYLNIIVNGTRKKLKLNIWAHVDSWDDNSKRIKSSYTSALEFNRTIGNAIERINKIVSDANVEDIKLTVSLVENKLQSQYIGSDFISYMDSAIDCRTDIKLKTKISQKITVKKLREFQPQIKVSDFTAATLMKFKSFLERKKYSANYIHNQIKTTKAYYIRLQDETGVKLPNIFSSIKTGWHKSGVTFLSIDELKKVKQHYELLKINDAVSTYTNCIRYYLFSCYTGLRISDINNLRSYNLIEKTLHVKVAKHLKDKEKVLQLPLNQPAIELWYEIHKANYPIIADQTKNKSLKKMASTLKINKKLNYHTSRHTYATTLLSLGANLVYLKDLLGHSSIKTTMIYTHVTDIDLIKSSNLLNDI